MPTFIHLSNVKNATVVCCDNSLDTNSAVFFNNLATKLLDMSKAIEKKMEDLSKQVCTPSRGFTLVQIDTPVMKLGVKYEYVEYIKRYGPPCDGIFDRIKLEQLRVELGIETI
jgi:hypothetical protein